MRWPGRLPCLLLLACGSADVACLHELATYSGEVQLTGAGGEQRRFDLAFDRAQGHLQVTMRGTAAVAVFRGEDGSVRMFRDGAPAPVTPEHEALLASVERIVKAPAGTEVTRVAGGYRIRLGGEWTTVQVQPRRGHGTR